MNFIIKITSLILSVLFLPSFSLAQNSLDEGLQDLSKQIVSEMSVGNKQKIAVIEFSDLDSKVTELGKYLSEELITRLFMSKRFKVVERHLLNKVLEEHKLTLSGIVDESTAKELGRILGVDALCSGTITDLVNSIKINARLISTETGTLFAVASTQILKDNVVQKLMGKVSYISSTSPSGSSTKKVISGKVIYHEDFSSVEEGLSPNGWLGTEHVMVKLSGRRKYLKNFEKGSSKILIPNIVIPDNFKIEWYCTYAPGRSSGHGETEFNLIVGSVKVGLKNNFYRDNVAWINETISKFGKINSQTFLMCLEKRGPVFRLYSGGSPIVLARVSNFKRPNSIVFDFHGYPFHLFSITITEL